MLTKIAKKLKNLPTSPGVYIFKNKSGEIIYIGKATSLKDRVGSYFRGYVGYARPIERFIEEVIDFEIRKTETVLEAYILEQSLIKKWQPKYNMDGKDDKSFCSVVVTKEEFPRFMLIREKERKKNFDIKYTKIYGPFISRKNIEVALKILRKIFPYHSKSQKTEKGCFDFQIGLCPGPYAGAISKREYARNIRGVQMILAGKKKTLLNRLRKEMSALSEKQEFEKAMMIRNQIFALQHIQDVALISNRDETRAYHHKTMRIEGYDISNIFGKYSVGSMVVFDNSSGELKANKIQYRKFKIKTVEGINDIVSMQEVLSRRLSNNWPHPDLIILDGGMAHLNAIRRVLRNFQLEIPLLAVAKGPNRKKLDRYIFGNVPEISENNLEQIRNEAHRFAIEYHKKIRSKNFFNND